jgi:hypothetical protein
MGRDNHPRERQARKLARKLARRNPYPRILIVCEGEKTEPQYFNEIRIEYRLSTANVYVTHPEGTSPRQIVEAAKEVFFQRERRFDEIYAVFDRDGHLRFDEAIQLAASLNNKLLSDEEEAVPFVAITSIPCFELWLLLHFQKVTHRIHRTTVVRELKKYLPDYEKGQGGHYARTKEHLAVAYANSVELAKLQDGQGKNFTSTKIPLLVRRLKKLKG